MSNFQAMRENDRDNILCSTDERAEEIVYTPNGFSASPGTPLTINAYLQRGQEQTVPAPNGGTERIRELLALVGRGATTGVATLSDDDKFTIDSLAYKLDMQVRSDRSVRHLKLIHIDDVEKAVGPQRRAMR